MYENKSQQSRKRGRYGALPERVLITNKEGSLNITAQEPELPRGNFSDVEVQTNGVKSFAKHVGSRKSRSRRLLD